MVVDSEVKFSSLLREFGEVCERRKLKDNVGKSKVRLGSEELEEVSEFTVLRSMVSTDDCIEAKLNPPWGRNENYGKVD